MAFIIPLNILSSNIALSNGLKYGKAKFQVKNKVGIFRKFKKILYIHGCTYYIPENAFKNM